MLQPGSGHQANRVELSSLDDSTKGVGRRVIAPAGRERRTVRLPRALPRAQKNPDTIMNPVKIAEAFYYLHTQDRSCWTHELQLTPFATKPSY